MPTISAVTPASGPTSSGTPVRIDGTNFVAGATVLFGGAHATSVVVSGGGTVITCVTPSHPPGPCDVVVINPDGQSATRFAGFLFSDPVPTIATVSPSNGPTTGGTAVSITGTNFLTGANVRFGAMLANNVVITPDGCTINCQSPASTSGGCDVVVTNVSGQSATRTGGFVYGDPAPIITNVTPATGPTTGGTAVTITGTNFLPGATVRFGATMANNIVINPTGTSITCNSPANASGGYDVIVTNVGGQSATRTGGFVYGDPAPTIANLTPASGPTIGGTAVTITGTNFLAGATVRFGAALANNVVINPTGTSITCNSPANSTGGYDVIVTNVGGQTATRTGGFVYSDPAPTIANLTPASGPTIGGTAVTITGTNFLPGATVRFGTAMASNVVINPTGTSITCNSPANSTGGYDVVVTNVGGQTATRTGGFVYLDPAPTIASLTPASGPTTGGTAVTITGTNFLAGATVRFGTALANNVVINAAGGVISCNSPANSTGGYDVIVSNVGGQSATRTGGFVYLDPAPTITNLTPATGPTTGGTAVTINGTNFLPGATVRFGAAMANNVVINPTGTSITCNSPANTTGGYDVVVTNVGGQTATHTGGFVYLDPAPTIASLTPASGPTTGGTAVTISGTNFLPGATVRFGAAMANNVVINPAGGAITCSSPPNNCGGYDVVVTNVGGQTATHTGGFVYTNPAPSISSLTPASGPTTGGTAVTISGANFLPGATVQFGSMLASNVVINPTGTSISCNSPANSSGGYDVIVTNVGGQSATRTGGFVYNNTAPTIANLTPASGPTSGGTAVTISGTNFLPGATVRFGAMLANNIVINPTGTGITCNSPANPTGGYDVIVTNVGGQSATHTGGFVYLDPAPTITNLTPASGPTTGGTTVNITGTNFLPGATVRFGAALANNVVINPTGTSITCNSPANSTGGYDVVVTNVGGQTATRTGGFVYLDPAPTITSLSPSSGPTTGGTLVTISGTNFLPGATVRFGPMLAGNVVVGPAGGAITCTTPANMSGGHDVIVTNVGGQSATRTGGFVYSDPAPTIANVTPATGPTAGGTTVTITGTNFLPGAIVRFGAILASNVVINPTGTSITCNSPANTSGGHDVIVTNVGGQSATRTGGFVYSDPAPTITAVTPNTGPSAGGTAVTITGTNFQASATIRFGAMPANNVVVNPTGTSISCVSPANAVGTYDVIIFNVNGSSATLHGAFIYT